MKARPILFSAPMVRPLPTGTKTQTRRTKALEYFSAPENEPHRWRCVRVRDGVAFFVFDHCPTEREVVCPYGKAGDLLWVRESVYMFGGPIEYAADGQPSFKRKLTPSIHMPRTLSRFTLKITDVRVERLWEISEADAIAEGVLPIEPEREEHDWSLCGRCGGTLLYNDASGGGMRFDCDCFECDTYAKRYRWLWDSLNGRDAWNANPWVWALTFEMFKKNVDACMEQAA